MHPRYESWLTHVFDHPVTDPQWHFQPEAPEFEGTDSDFAALITETFRRSGQDLTRFSDSQVNQGLWYIASPSCSNFIFSLRDDKIPLNERINGINSIYDLYKECFASRCTEKLGHLDESGTSALNPICYMFWDVCPLTFLQDSADEKTLVDSVFSVLIRTLQIPHRACREAALHGLSEFAYAYPERVAETIDSFLNRENLDEPLLVYAMKAREGLVQ